MEIEVEPEKTGATSVIEPQPAGPGFKGDEVTGQSMPSVTSLLERKKLQAAVAAGTRSAAASGLTTPPPSPSSGPTIIPFRGRALAPATPLIRWTTETLQANPDPLAARVREELAKGARVIVFLSVSPTEKSAKDPTIPLFCAQACVVPDGDVRPALLMGMKWDPTLVPQIWNALRTQGRAEFLSPATQTDMSSERNAIRAAFAAEKPEKLTLVRIDDGNQCRGVLGLYSS